MFTKTPLYLAAFCLATIACTSKKPNDKPTGKNPNTATVVDVLIAQPQNITNSIEVNGSVLAQEMLTINPEISGRLTYLNVPDGAVVNAGTILAKINDAELQAQLKKSKAQLELAQKTEERLKKLLSINGVNQADYDVAVNNINNILADIELTQAQIDKTIIKAPFSGVLGLRQTSPGAFVTPQTIIATLQQVNTTKIDFSVPEEYATNVKKGTTVTITLSTQNSSKGYATVIATEPEINASTRNLKIRAIPKAMQLTAGSFVKVTLGTSTNNNNIVIPTNAIIPDASAKKVIVVKDGKGKMINVETGLRMPSGIEITKGLMPGDSVIVTGVLFVRPNSPVKVRSVKKVEDLLKVN